ncbi:MAG: methyl-accepting chemotaxis protein [Rubrivivax sp.]
MSKLKVSTQLSILIGTLLLLMVGMAAIGLWSNGRANEALKSVYEDRTVPVQQIGDIQHHQLLSQVAIDVALLEPNAEQLARSEREVENNAATITKLWEAYMATYLTDEEKQLARAFVEARARYRELALLPTLAALRVNDLAAARRLEASAIRPLYAEVDQRLEDLMALQTRVARETYDAEAARYATVRSLSLVATALALLFGTGLGVVLVRGISRQLGGEPAQAAALVDSVARGDLTVSITLRPGDEHSLMASLARMRDNLREVVAGVRRNADGVASASTQIAQGNFDLSQRTEEQASALQQTAASMEQLGTTVRHNADSAQQANQLSQGASEVAGRGGEAVGRVVDTMKQINASSKRIADIISVIDGIAFQTNILALNAAVEAARAGDQGRGFAVVAGEVRVLAQRSGDAAREIKTLIHDSVERVERGTQQVDEAGRTMTEIVESIRRVSMIMNEIHGATSEQSAGVAQIGQAVAQLDQTTQQNAALVEESAAAAESLRVQAERLVNAVSVFRLGTGDTPAPPAASSAAAAPSGPARPAPRTAARSQHASSGQPARPVTATAAVAGHDAEWAAF